MNNKQSFSEVYGLQADAVKELVGGEHIQAYTLQFYNKFPHTLASLRLKKSRARMMVQVMVGFDASATDKGNIMIMRNKPDFAENEYGTFRFFYRGTEILEWNPFTDAATDIHAGAYEDTASTRNQRKMAREAIEEFKKVVLDQ